MYYRKQLIPQVREVQAKTLLNHIALAIRDRKNISDEKALLIAFRAKRYLEKEHLGIKPGQITLPLTYGLDRYFSNKRIRHAKKAVALTVVDEEDALLVREFGTKVMQQNRLARLIEEAYAEGALLESNHLCLLMPLPISAIRERLEPFWQQHITLPLVGMTHQNRAMMVTFRHVEAIKRYLGGEKLRDIRLDLAISSLTWNRWWKAFQEVSQQGQDGIDYLATKLELPTYVISNFKDILSGLSDNSAINHCLVGTQYFESCKLNLDEQSRFKNELISEYNYSDNEASLFIQELKELASNLKCINNNDAQIIIYNVASREPECRKLSKLRLKLICLDYITDNDRALIKRTGASKLRWVRLERLCSQSYEQGATPNPADLANLLGISVGKVQKTIMKNKCIAHTAQSQSTTINATLDHIENILYLYMAGHTKSEIKAKTGYHYTVIASHIFDFARVIYLKEQGVPPTLICETLSSPRKLVDRYLKLCEYYSQPEYKLRMALVRKQISELEVK